MLEWPNGRGNSIKKILKSVQIRVNQWLKSFFYKMPGSEFEHFFKPPHSREFVTRFSH